MTKLVDITGKRFGKLTVIKQAGRSKQGIVLWECVCDCGVKTVVWGTALRNGATQSCGCVQRHISAEYHTKHNQYGTRLYKIWINMKDRCNNENCPHFKDYGGRGITVCYDWNNSFENFYAWAMSNGYDNQLTIDRINNNGNYNADNCRWVTRAAQNRNKRNSHNITIDGITKIAADWADDIHVSKNSIYQQLKKGDDAFIAYYRRKKRELSGRVP